MSEFKPGGAVSKAVQARLLPGEKVYPAFRPGTRIIMNERSAWPERVGCAGVVVDPAIFSGIYPADKRWIAAGRERIVLLDDDPLRRGDPRPGPRWTCVTSIESLSLDINHRTEEA